MTFKIENINEETIYYLEKLRYNAYDMITSDIPYNQTYYAKELRNNKYIVYSAYIDNKIVGACYVSNSLNSLYIEQLFVRKDLQNTSYNIGKSLLSYVLHNKQHIRKKFNKDIKTSYLSTRSKDLEKYYEKLGYEKVDDNYMKKAI